MEISLETENGIQIKCTYKQYRGLLALSFFIEGVI